MGYCANNLHYVAQLELCEQIMLNKNDVGVFLRRHALKHLLGLRSPVAPLRCRLSYPLAKVGNVFETAKGLGENFRGIGEIGQK